MFYGSYVALLTPFDNGEVDELALRKMINRQIESGTQGLVPMGTTGESSTATEAEHKLVVKITVEEAVGRIPVIAGAGSNNPYEACKYAQFAEEQGADGVLCVAGYYNRPSQQGLYEHFKLIHDNSSIPIIIYNIPPRTIVDISAETMARLAALPRVVGVKDATGDLSRVSQERLQITTPFNYFSGDDLTALAYNTQGCRGCISVTANLFPAHCARLQAACLAGDYTKALILHEQLLPLHQALFLEPSPAGVKYAASLLGWCRDEVRLPILPISDETKKIIQQAVESLS